MNFAQVFHVVFLCPFFFSDDLCDTIL
jgi:hypothetical protein